MTHSEPSTQRYLVLGWVVALVLLVLLAFMTYRYAEERARRKQQGTFGAWPIPVVRLGDVDAAFAAGPFGPGVASEVAFIGRGPFAVPGGTSDAEAWVLSVLAKGASRLFEFGTCTGKTAYLWARNAREDAQVVTLTLAPDQQAKYTAAASDSKADTNFALEESNFTSFLYTGTVVADRVTQLYGDSKAFDETKYLDWADLIFVDGSHARSYVESDSAKAMRIVKPGGVVLWHDYAGPHHAAGVYEALNALSRTCELRRVEGTTLVMWRRPMG